MSTKRGRTGAKRAQTSANRGRPMRKPVSRTPVWVGPAAVAAVVALVVATFLVIRWYTTPLAPNYLGGEFCPYCAAERWPLIIALSRFGMFSGLQATSSSSTIEYPNTPTFTFRNATYTSQYIDFRGIESSDRDRKPLQSPTAAEQQLFNKYDAQGTIPFVDLGNRYVFVGSMYLPDALAGKSWQVVANDLQEPSSVQAKAIIGSANLLTAAICKMTSDQPATVCSSTTIQDLEKKLG